MIQSLPYWLSGTFRISLNRILTVSCIFFFSFHSSAQPILSWSASDYNGFGVSCFGSSDGFIDLTVTGGMPPFDFLWSNNETTEDISGLTAGFYSVQVIDANQDTVTATIQITEPSELIASLQSSATVSCFGGSNGAVNVNITGGTQPYQFLWSNGATTQNIGSLSAGTYTLTVTDANNCTANFSATITEPGELIVTLQSTVNVSCFLGNDGAINVILTGGTQPYQFLWSNGETTQNIGSLSAGTYTLTVTDANNCTANFSAIIS
ncbi:MAG: SprB repeat-containing protein, partial [Bacteroidia bacterium]|nr:SprB repeat-containing protein [Bacteroidia bacterium]